MKPLQYFVLMWATLVIGAFFVIADFAVAGLLFITVAAFLFILWLRSFMQ